MSILKSSAENLTLNADGANNDIIFQSNGSNIATLDQAGLLTATTFAGSGASLTALPAAQVSGTHTNFTSTGIDDNAAGATAITITSDENIGIGEVDPQTDLSILTSGGANISDHDAGIQVRHTGADGEISGLTAGDIANTTYNCGFIGFIGGSGTASGQRHIALAT